MIAGRETAAVRFDDSAAHGKAQAHISLPVPGGGGGVANGIIKQMGQQGGRDAPAIVPDGESGEAVLRLFYTEVNGGGGDAVGGGVLNEIGENLLDQNGIHGNHQQIIRAGLEDHFMGKLHGLPMGCDCCYTNHADTDQNSNENLMILLATAGVNFIISLPMGDDIMLNYQTNSFHDIATARQLLNLRPAPEFEQWLERHGIMENGCLTSRAGDASIFF